MAFPPEELGRLALPGILKEAVSIMFAFPKEFFIISITLILPLWLISVSILLEDFYMKGVSRGVKFTIEWWYFVFINFLLACSTKAVAFKVTSRYASKRASFKFPNSVIPRKVWPFIFTNFVSSIFTAYAYFPVCKKVLSTIKTLYSPTKNYNTMVRLTSFIGTVEIFLLFHFIWVFCTFLPTLVAILEPAKGCFKAVDTGFYLAYRKFWSVLIFVTVNQLMAIPLFEDRTANKIYHSSMLVKIIGGVLLSGFAVLVFLFWLIVQSVFYFVGKSHMEESIDKDAFCANLGLEVQTSTGKDEPLEA